MSSGERMSHKIIKPDLDLVLRDFLFLAWWQLYIQRSLQMASRHGFMARSLMGCVLNI